MKWIETWRGEQISKQGEVVGQYQYAFDTTIEPNRFAYGKPNMASSSGGGRSTQQQFVESSSLLGFPPCWWFLRAMMGQFKGMLTHGRQL